MPYFITSCIFFLLGLGVIVWVHSQYHMDIVVTPAKVSTPAPLISLCVPARDEEKNIRRCVEALLAQTYPNFEILVLDDRSTDSTPQILDELASRDSRLRVCSTVRTYPTAGLENPTHYSKPPPRRAATGYVSWMQTRLARQRRLHPVMSKPLRPKPICSPS
jgi:cellulose synthase/poly-beta-1,6-N-acetylglucosamine synthase-like glycosyltransferase